MDEERLDGTRTPKSDQSLPSDAPRQTEHVEEKEYSLHGTYYHSVDPKGRVIIPQQFRDEMGDDIVVAVNTAQDSIAVYPASVWRERLRMLSRLVKKKRSMEPILNRFSMLSYPGSSYDQQGRVLIPILLRDMYLKGEQKLQVSGSFDHVRIISETQARAEEKRFINGADVLDMISSAQAEFDE